MTISEKVYPPTAAPSSAKARRRRGAGVRKRTRLLLWQLVTVAVIAALWTLVYETGALSREIVPPPWDVVHEFLVLAVTGAFWTALATTVSNALIGLAVGVVVGVPLGLLLGISAAAYRSAQFLIDLCRSFPVIALLPVMVLVLGATSEMETVVVFSGVLWPILLQTIYGARRIDQVIADTVRSYRIPALLRFAKVVLPNAAPMAATGVRIAASASILIAVGVEVLSLTPGMGGNLARAQTDGAPALAMAYVVYAGLVGLVLNKVLWIAESRVLSWNRRTTEAER